MHLLHLHGHSKELVLCCGDDYVSLTQDGQEVVSAWQEAPVADVGLQDLPGLEEDLWGTSRNGRRKLVREEDAAAAVLWEWKCPPGGSVKVSPSTDSRNLQPCCFRSIKVVKKSSGPLSCSLQAQTHTPGELWDFKVVKVGPSH